MQRLTTHLMNSSNHMDLVSRTQLPSVQIDAVDRLHYVVSCVFRLCTLEVVCKHSGCPLSDSTDLMFMMCTMHERSHVVLRIFVCTQHSG